MNADQAAEVLGVSRRQVYALAAPGGPIPCTRIGKRIIFDMPDILEFKQSCRSTATNNRVRLSLSSRAVSTGSASGLQSAFLALGIKPKLTHSTGKSRRSSTPPPQGRVVHITQSKMP